MHPNPIFRQTPTEQNIAFARLRSFGILAVNSENGPLLSHIPFNLDPEGSYLEAHLVRSNPILRLLEGPVTAVLAISGDDAYVSPDWYGIEEQVPTWNYVAVHLRGKIRRLADEELPGILDRLSDTMEARLAPKKPWTTDKMDPDNYARMRRQIVPIGMDIKHIDGTWKLSQNKPASARTGVTSALKTVPSGSNSPSIADLIASNLAS